MRATNIVWDTNGEDVVLPTEIELPDGMVDQDEISDYISDQTGYCHKGFCIEDSFTMNDISTIENPLTFGASYECIHHYKYPNGSDMCSKNHIGILTRMCPMIPVCSLFHRNYCAGAPEMKG